MKSILAACGRASAQHRGKLSFVMALVLLNCLIGLNFWIGNRKAPVLSYLIVSNAIGFSAYVLSEFLGKITRGRFGIVPLMLIIAPVSVVIGVDIAAKATGRVPLLFEHTSISTWLSFGPTFLMASIACAFASILFRSSQMRAALETQRREAAELRQSETAARLALLQAQIEPHFLFNTLANVQSLIDRDPSRASTMLGGLNRYLRASLGRTRNAITLVEEELELVDALLRIASIRLGERLMYTISVPDSLRQLALPPLLLQPLVENAVIHGIEPAIDGGEIVITGTRQGDMLELNVVDTGVGLGNSTRLHGGVGLENVRARLNTLYGTMAEMSVSANTKRGVTARLLIPIR